MGELWIGVTGLYATDNPQPGLAVLRALRLADPSWRLVALPFDENGTGTFATDLIDAVWFLPHPARGREALRKRVQKLLQRQPLNVLIPTADIELSHYVAVRNELKRLGVQTVLPSARALQQRDNLAAVGRRAGVRVPEQVCLRSGKDVVKMSERLRFPQIVKGAFEDSLVVHSAEEFRVMAGKLVRRRGHPLVTQPLISGEAYNVAALIYQGKLLGAAVMRKLADTNKGTAWAGVTVASPELIEVTRNLARALGWDGPLEAEFIRTRDNEIYCIEANPRFPSWVMLAAEAGANLPATLVRLALGHEVEVQHGRPGRLFARATMERIFEGNPLSELQEGRVPAVCASLSSPPRSRPTQGVHTVAITGLHAGDNPSPGLTVGRALRAAPEPLRLIGFTHEVLASGGYVGGLWDEVRLVPFPSREEGYREALLEACRAANVNCLIPTLDIEIPLMVWLAPRLADAGVATLLPSPEALAAIAKPRLGDLRSAGFRVPRMELIWALHGLTRTVRTLGLPLVVKGPLADARVVHTAEEARVVAGRLAATWGFPLIAQEFITGPEFAVAAVADRHHRIAGSVLVRKEIQTANGNTWAGTVVADRTPTRMAERFAEAVGWVGPFELEIIRHPRRGPFLIEVNPRFPGWVYASAGAGVNLPWIAMRAARGERVEPLTPRVGTFYVRMAWDVTAPVERMGTLAVEGLLSTHVA